jgi:hypothetical protein
MQQRVGILDAQAALSPAKARIELLLALLEAP